MLRDVLFDVMRPSPPVVASGLSGFVIGVIVALLATGIVSPPATSTAGKPTLPPATLVPQSQMHVRVQKIVAGVLGNVYPGGKHSRLEGLSLVPVGPSVLAPEAAARLDKLQSVFIQFRLNDHPLGKVWRLRAARSDVFQVMKALYTTPLPVYNVIMDGYFPVQEHGRVTEQRVLVAYMDHSSASNIPWRRWDRGHEGQLWQLLSYHWVDPKFG